MCIQWPPDPYISKCPAKEAMQFDSWSKTKGSGEWCRAAKAFSFRSTAHRFQMIPTPFCLLMTSLMYHNNVICQTCYSTVSLRTILPSLHDIISQEMDISPCPESSKFSINWEKHTSVYLLLKDKSVTQSFLLIVRLLLVLHASFRIFPFAKSPF